MSTEGSPTPSGTEAKEGDVAAARETSVPRDRYGRVPRTRGPARRWRTWALVALVALVGAAVAFLADRNLGTAPIEANRTSFRQLPGNALEVTMRVRREDSGSPAVCVVKVRSINGAETGRREVLVPPGSTVVTTTIRSTDPPVTASVVGCSYNVPPHMSTS